MVKSYSKIISRQMKSRIGRFLAMVAIIFLGVCFITGLSATSPNMKDSVSEYYNKYNAPDIIIKAPSAEKMLTPEDLEAIKENSWVENVTPALSFDDMVDGKATRMYCMDLSNDDAVGRVELIAGRWPEKLGEIMVERSGVYIQSADIGSKITYSGLSFEVVGIVGNPWYFYKEKEVADVGLGWLERIAYMDIENLPDSLPIDTYTDAMISVKGNKGLDAFSKQYKDNTKKAVDELSELSVNDGWYLLDRQMNVGFTIFNENSNKIEAIANVFPVFFVLIVALVVLSTMSRMVEEERTEIGTLKFLGYSNTRIAFKYLLYGLLACLIGSVAGLIVGFRILPIIIYGAISAMFHAPALMMGFYFWTGIIACVLMTMVIILATLYSVASSLKENPAKLLRAKAPKPGKRVLLEKIPFLWNRLKFKYKSSIRNIFRHKKNLVMTIVGIAGCTALVFAGFGLRDSINSIANVQYGEIIRYDFSAKLSDENYKEDEDFQSFLSGTDDYVESLRKMGKVSFEEEDTIVNLVVFRAEDATKVKDFISIRERKKQVPLVLNNAGVIVSEGMARMQNLKEGDSIVFDDASYIIDGITENYTENYIYMIDSVYSKEFIPTHILIRNSNTEKNEAEIRGMLMDYEGVSSVEFVSETSENNVKVMQTMNLLIVIVILAAGALAVIVIYNLTNLNIEERKKEIATLKVLGYTDFETAGYIYREIAIQTAIGAGIGLGVGYLLQQYIITLVDGANIMMGRHTNWYSFVLAAGFTFVFTAIVGLLMYGKLKKVDMNSSLKVSD